MWRLLVKGEGCFGSFKLEAQAPSAWQRPLTLGISSTSLPDPNLMTICHPGVSVDVYTTQHPRHNIGRKMSSIEEPLASFNWMAEPPSVENLICILQTCRERESFVHAKHFYACLCEIGMEDHAVLENYLVPMFVECGSILEAQKVFHRLVHRNEHSWTSLIQGYVECGNLQHTINLYQKMREDCIQPSNYTYVAVLKGCGRHKYVENVKEIHDDIILGGCERDLFVGSTLVDIYAKCGSLGEAQDVLYKLPARNVVSWTALITGYAENGLGEEALNCLKQMQLEGMHLDPVILNCGLKACSSIGALESGQKLHADIAKQGYERELLLNNTVVDMYAKCGLLAEAQGVFDKLPNRDVITWTALLAGYVEHGFAKEALSCLEQMQLEGVSPDEVVFVLGLKACGSVGALNKGLEIHSQIAQQGDGRDPYVGAAIVNMYVKCGSIAEAQETFDELRIRDAVSWNALIGGYAEHGFFKEALNCLEHMQQEGVPPDKVSFVWSMKSCGNMGFIEKAHEIHAQIFKEGYEEDPFVGCAIVDVYVKCDSLAEAQEVFDGLLVKDAISWNALISGYSEYGSGEDVLRCLEQMLSEGTSPSVITYVCSLKACSSLGFIERGQKLHIEVLKKGLEIDTGIGNNLVDMYVKCGLLIEGQEIFNKLHDQDVVSWTALISGYAEHGLGKGALNLFQQMQLEGMSPDVVLWNAVILSCSDQGEEEIALVLYARMQEQGLLPNTVIFGSILQACGDMAALEIGKKFHARIHKINEVILATALVDMYCKCGSMDDAQQVFTAMSIRDLVAWDALIKGYARQVEFEIVFDMLQRMSMEGIDVEGGIFLSLITVCSHAGLVLKGQQYFEAMSNEFGISPTMLHCNSMLDLLGRAGQLEEAVAIVEMVPIQADLVVWNTVLAACQKWGNLEYGKQAFDLAVTLDDGHAAAYVLMSNIYADGHLGYDME